MSNHGREVGVAARLGFYRERVILEKPFLMSHGVRQQSRGRTESCHGALSH